MRIIMSRLQKHKFAKPPIIVIIIHLLFCPAVNRSQDHVRMIYDGMPLSLTVNQRQADSWLLSPPDGRLVEKGLNTISQSELRREFDATKLGVWAEQHRQLSGEGSFFANDKEKKMDDHDKILADLMRLERWQRVAFAAACAERVALFVRSFGCSESVALYEQGLEMAWLSVTRKDLGSQAKRLIKKLEKSPEARIGVERNDAYVGTSLNILAHALEAGAGNDVEAAEQACDLILEFRSDTDNFLTEESQRITKYNMDNPPPSGPLEVLELKYQLQTLELIKSAQEPNAELINSLRRLSQEANRDLEFAVSELRKRKQ